MLKVALVFTIGCSVLVCNAVLSTLPLISGLRLKLPEQCIYVEGVLSVLSCSLFLLGSFYAFLEAWAVDEAAEPCFATKLQGMQNEEWSERSEVDLVGVMEEQAIPQAHYPSDWNNSHADLFKHFSAVPEDDDRSTPTDTRSTASILPKKAKHEYRPASHFRSRYLHLRVFASTIFLASSALYCASSIASLITIIQSGTIARCIRYPQLLAASGFAVASFLLIVKIQKDSQHWWRPKVRSAGFHTNFWNLFGSIAFIFCAYFGLLEHVSWAQQQLGFSYLWGSWAFFAGALLQWYRSVRAECVVEACRTKNSTV